MVCCGQTIRCRRAALTGVRLNSNVEGCLGSVQDLRIEHFEGLFLVGRCRHTPQLTYVGGYVSFLDLQQAGVDPLVTLPPGLATAAHAS